MDSIRNLTDEEKMKYCYDYCVANDWERSAHTFNKILLYSDEIRHFAYQYIKQILKRDLNLEEFYFLLDRKSKTLIKSSMVCYMVNKGLIELENLNNLDWIKECLDEVVCKFCYETFEVYDWVVADIRDFCEQNNLNYKVISEGCRKYFLHYLGKPEKEFNELRQEGQRKSYRKSYYTYRNEVLKKPLLGDDIVSRILNAKTKEEIIEIMKSNASLPSDVSKFSYEYSVRHGLDYDKLREELNRRLNYYKEYLNAKKIKDLNDNKRQKDMQFLKEKLPDVEVIINGFLISDFISIKDYCKYLGTDFREFKKVLNLLEQYDKELYLKYKAAYENRKSKNYDKIRLEFNNIMNFIRNGIVDANTSEIREFDLLDYYEIISIHPQDLFLLITDMTKDEYTYFKLFIAKYGSNKILTKMEIKNIFETEQIVNAKVDENFKPIPGTGRKIEVHEKQQIIDYLNSKKIPVTNYTYDLAFKKWLNGDISFDKGKKVYKISL